MSEASRHASELARRGAAKAAERMAARAAAMTPEERSELGRIAAQVRWAKRDPLSSVAHLLRMLARIIEDENRLSVKAAIELADLIDSRKDEGPGDAEANHSR